MTQSLRKPMLLIGMIFATPVFAQSILPGLWEIQGKATVDGQAMPDMAEMMKEVPPEMRKQMQAMLNKQGVGMTPSGIQVCVTPEQALRNDIPVQGDKRCKLTWQKRAPKRTTYQLICTQPNERGEGWMEIVSPKLWKSSVKMHTQSDGKPQTVTSDSSGKWLGPDCGKVQPAARR